MQSSYSLGEDESIFWIYWQKVRNYINALIALPDNIGILLQRVAVIQSEARRTGDTSAIRDSSDSLRRLGSLLNVAVDVKNKIIQWLPTWKKKVDAESPGSGPVQLGFLQFVILGAAAIAALAYVSMRGLELIKEYESEKNIVEHLEATQGKPISLQQATELVKATKPIASKGIVEQYAYGMGAGLTSIFKDYALPIAAVGLGIFALVYWQPKYKQNFFPPI